MASTGHLPLLLRLVACAVAACPAALSAQSGKDGFVDQPLFDGAVILSVDGAMLESAPSERGQSFRFWRPILFQGDPWPVAGRMDCHVSARELPYSEASFDLDGRYAKLDDQRDKAGYGDQRRIRDYSESVRRLDIVGLRPRPHEHYVHSFIAMRHGDAIYDMLMNCTFRHGEDSEKADYAALVDRYVAVKPADASTTLAEKKTPDAQTH